MLSLLLVVVAVAVLVLAVAVVVFQSAELPTVTFWPYFDTVTLKMYGNMVC